MVKGRGDRERDEQEQSRRERQAAQETMQMLKRDAIEGRTSSLSSIVGDIEEGRIRQEAQMHSRFLRLQGDPINTWEKIPRQVLWD